MTDLHVVFRPWSGRWESYSSPVSIYSGGTTLADAQARFRDAAEFHFMGAWPQVDVHEHVEHEGAPGILLRTALDGSTRDREAIATTVRTSLDAARSARALRERALESSTGDVVVVCCTPDDRVAWVAEQLGRTDAVQVAVRDRAGGTVLIPWVGPDRDIPPSEVLTLSGLGVDPSRDTLDDVLVALERYRSRNDDRSQLTLVAAA